MSEENVELIRGGYDDFNSGNVQGVVDRLDEDVEWNEPGGGNAPSGTYRKDQILSDVFSAVQENFDEFLCTPENFEDEDSKVTVTGRFTGKNKNGAELNATFTHEWEVKGGKITRLENKPDMDAWSAGWS
jgi:ketosteroid isomerase-like protein